jgi:hypothetical protein
MSMSVQATTGSILVNPLDFLFSRFKKPKAAQKDTHLQEIHNAWVGLRNSYSRLYLALNELEAKEGDVIKFSHLAEVLNIPDNIIQNYFDTVCFTCIDERAQKNTHNALSVGIPGQFCLEKKNCSYFAKKIVVDCLAANIKKIKLMPHARCGASTLAVKAEFDELGWDTKNIPDILIDKKAIDYAQRMADTITETAQKMDYSLEVEIEFIGVQEIEPRTFHNAVGSLVNVTSSHSLDLTKPHLDPRLFNEYIDPMFNISGFGEDEMIIDRLTLSVDIAFGGDGLGEIIFSKENPYLILMVADSQEAVTRTREQLLPMFKSKIEERYADHLVESFVLDISDLKATF